MSGKNKYQSKASGEQKERIHYYNHHGAYYHHPNSRRFNYHYHHYNNNHNAYNGYNNNNYYSNNYQNQYYGHNHYYNNNFHQSFSQLSPSPAAAAASAVPSPVPSPQPRRVSISSNPLQQNGAFPSRNPSPTIPKVNNQIDYWTSPSGVESENELDLNAESSAVTSVTNSHGTTSNNNNHFIFSPSKRTQKTQNGTAAGKVVLTTIDAPSPVKTVTLSSENGCTPYHKQEDSNSNKETELKQRGKFYLDGYLGLALEFVDPDELVRKFKKSEIIERPENFAAEGTLWADLSEAIWQKFKANQQTVETFRKKMELWSDLNETLQSISSKFKHYRHFGLQVVGSTLNGFGSNTSDVDMCLLVRRAEIDQQSEAVDLLHQFWAALGKPPYLDKIEMIYAKIPLLKCRDPIRNLEVDLNCNNFVGVRNTHLMYCYSQQDWRLRPLVIIIKLWAKFHDINDAKSMTISSYSLVLMVIHYLQCAVSPPVLPCLHKLYPSKFTFYSDISKFTLAEDVVKEISHNTQTLGELLVRFFEYFAVQYDYKSSAISVRQGSVIPIRLCQAVRNNKNDHTQWKHLCIEEPFDYTNTARSVYDRDTFDRIRGIFFASWQRLALSGDLDSIFTPISSCEARQIGIRLRCGA